MRARACSRKGLRVSQVIHVGGCIEWLETLGDSSVGVTICDPPYSDHVHEKSVTQKGRNSRRDGKGVAKKDLGFAPLSPALRRDFAIEVTRVTRRWTLIFCDEENVPAWKWDLRGAGLEVLRTCIWVKPDCSPQMTGDRPGAGWEAIVVAHRMNDKGKPGKKRWNGGGHRGVYVHGIPRGERTNATEKPLPLLIELVSHFSDPGELVIDPFAGSGTTGVACLRLGRFFAGAELDPEMAQKASERIAAENECTTVQAKRAKQTTIFDAPPRSRDLLGEPFGPECFGGSDFP